jgi:F-type H+-transporting ATPase subunit b
LDKLGINVGNLLVQILNFLIVLVVLRAWVLKPLLGMLEKRQKTVEKGLEDARVASEARENAEKDAAAIMADAQAKAAQTIREATEKAEAAARELRAATDADLTKVRESAMAEVEVERQRTLTDLRGQVASLAIAAAQRLIGENLDEKRQHVLLDEFFSGVKDGKIVVLEGVPVGGARAEVTSALPLSADEQTSVRNNLLPSLEKNAEVEFKVDPSILGGLVVRMGDQVVDGSVAGQLQSLRQTLR